MPRRFTFSIALFAALPVAAALSFADTPANQNAAPTPLKLERKNFTEKTTAFKTVVDDEKSKPIKTHREVTKSQFEMVYVPGGEVTIGSPETEPGRQPNEGPRYKAKVGNFWMQKCEVTWDEWDVFWYDDNFPVAPRKEPENYKPDAITRPTNTWESDSYDNGRDGFPVLSMTHHAAMMYCHWLRAKTGRKYRLPTEAEWEYAARGGKGDSAYFFGNDPKELGEYAWFAENSKDEDFLLLKPKGCTHKGGTRKPNPFGIYDLYGNVWEWTLDQYDPKTYENRAKNPLNIRPVNVPTADKWSHVVRGGSWADKADKLRSASRRVSDDSWQKNDPQVPRSIWWLTKMDVIGFRVVLAEEEQPELADLKPKVRKVAE